MKSLRDAPVQEEIRVRLGRVTGEDTAQWGSMTAHQMICHLRDSYWVGLGKKEVAMIAIPMPRAVMKQAALHVPIPWRKNFKSAPEVAQDVGGTPPVEFASDRDGLLQALDLFCSHLPEPCPPHPYFGEMSADDWWRWGYLHADHHLRQFGR